MSFTRFHDDPNRIQKTNLETSAINDYTFNVPGNTNTKSLFVDDPYVRMQKNGTTLCRNMVNIEAELHGLDRVLCRDNLTKNNYLKTQMVKQYIRPSSLSKNITKQSRASHPAWMVRTTKNNRSDFLLEDPQKNVELPFLANLDTNILEKDYYNINHV